MLSANKNVPFYQVTYKSIKYCLSKTPAEFCKVFEKKVYLAQTS